MSYKAQPPTSTHKHRTATSPEEMQNYKHTARTRQDRTPRNLVSQNNWLEYTVLEVWIKLRPSTQRSPNFETLQPELANKLLSYPRF